LVSLGVSVLAVERNRTTSNEAKAISLDAESLRTFQAAGLSEQIERLIVPGTGTRYYDRRDRSLFQANGGRPYQLGFAFKNQFAQPELEDVLAEVLVRRHADMRFSTELVNLTEHEGGVTARLRELSSGQENDVEVSWVVACDGGRSTVRQLLGIEMSGRSHDQTWLVVDTVGDYHRERYAMHHGNPDRPVVIVAGRGGRCRYEFRLKDGEGVPGEPPTPAFIAQLLAPYRTLTHDEIERSVVYRFHAIVANQWHTGRCFLMGDAAHMMPPFAGQGLNSGVRDAANLAWKLAMVWHGTLGEEVLQSYEPERRPHATAMVEFSERLGDVVMTTNRWRALVRDLVVRIMLVAPAARRYLTEMRYRPKALHSTGVVSRLGRSAQHLVGTLLPQPFVIAEPSLRPQRLDEVLGNGLALLGVDVENRDWDRVYAAAARAGLPDMRAVDVVLADRLPTATGQRTGIADADGTLERLLSCARGTFVLVKPDRYIAAVFAADEAERVAVDLARWLRVPAPTTDDVPGTATASAAGATAVRLESA
jgi:3-(3-hydroxy-phenyl)propionate hydroxylase